jgi:hypothetical protein
MEGRPQPAASAPPAPPGRPRPPRPRPWRGRESPDKCLPRPNWGRAPLGSWPPSGAGTPSGSPRWPARSPPARAPARPIGSAAWPPTPLPDLAPSKSSTEGAMPNGWSRPARWGWGATGCSTPCCPRPYSGWAGPSGLTATGKTRSAWPCTRSPAAPRVAPEGCMAVRRTALRRRGRPARASSIAWRPRSPCGTPGQGRLTRSTRLTQCRPHVRHRWRPSHPVEKYRTPWCPEWSLWPHLTTMLWFQACHPTPPKTLGCNPGLSRHLSLAIARRAATDVAWRPHSVQR